jgi:hypothetical protein
MTVLWVVAPCSPVVVYRYFTGACWFIVLMMEAENTSETSVNVYRTTKRKNPKDSHINTRRYENLRFHMKRVRFFEVVSGNVCIANLYWPKLLTEIYHQVLLINTSLLYRCNHLMQSCPTGGPRAACGHSAVFLRPTSAHRIFFIFKNK